MLPQKRFAYLISFEGLDAVGKTTLASGLVDYLKKAALPVQMFSEFSDSPIGALLIESIRRHNFIRLHPSFKTPFSETLLLMADLSVKNEMLWNSYDVPPIVIADRYSDSLIAYQVPRILKSNPTLRHHEVQEWLGNCVETLFGKPDLTWLISAPMDVVLARVRARDSYLPTAEDEEFFKQAEVIFATLAEGDKERIREVDGTKEPKALLSEITAVVSAKLAGHGLAKSN